MGSKYQSVPKASSTPIAGNLSVSFDEKGHIAAMFTVAVPENVLPASE